ncbi:MAG: ATP-dependent zinc metalloprotease FtsH [Flavobacteriales bacterium]|nr:ATP-dependent zinc metalloprotease FtsH [Flavobacteriales bacterium]MCB9192687.1 ATP-dependent zinc metalloprotease FtsH [Flavobacteriales bacterium]MCB9205214.1 ATP-dependent zinc metalloprotease FtsH [Flavobacteriales bacterium]
MSEEKKNKDKKDKKDQKGSKFDFEFKFNFYWVYVIIAILFIAMTFAPDISSESRTLDDTAFNELVRSQDVERIVVVNKQMAEIYIEPEALKEKEEYKDIRNQLFGNALNPGPHFKYEIGDLQNFENDLNDLQADFPKEELIAVKNETRRNWGDAIGWFLPIILLIGVWIFLMRRMSGGAGGGAQIFNIGKSRAQVFEGDMKVNVTFDDVAGLDEAKVEIKEIVDFLKNPQKYTDLGAQIPKGALLVGPPGTGKTLLAKAVAGEAQVPFFSLSGSDFVEMFVGVGASRVRDLFKQAKEKAPAIIFIDEIDAIGRARGKSISQGANDERENTLNQLLTEMDGFGTNSGVIILAATNRADILDRALMRAGRFDRQILVDMPDLLERIAIFKVHLKKLKLDKNVEVEFLGKQTPGFSGADIANMCNEAALIAARKGKKAVEKQDFLDAVDRIIGGLEKKNKIISKEEKKVIAYHEAGHAAVSWLTEHANPLIKVTIVPRGRSLGAAWYLPEERQITTKEQMLDEMCAALGGRAAEEIVFGKVSTGALSDLEKITKQAYAMVTVYGLSDKIGNISYYDSTGQSEYSFSKPYSEKTAETIDQEVKDMVEKAYERTKKILEENKDKLEKLANELLEKEVIFKENLEVIFGKRPWDKEEEGTKKPVNGSAKEVLDELSEEASTKAESVSEKSEKDDSLPQS